MDRQIPLDAKPILSMFINKCLGSNSPLQSTGIPLKGYHRSEDSPAQNIGIAKHEKNMANTIKGFCLVFYCTYLK